MPNTTSYRTGDIILVPFPFTDQTTSKKRPAVIVSSDPYNQSKSDLILMAVTSQVTPSQSLGEVLIADWQAAGLIKQSVIKPVFTTLEKRLVIRTLGHLHTQDIQKLKQSIQMILGT